ncbi:MAG: tRNA dihydrouridine(20/20a) synthase DusA [Gammaproteobacteria bacterium]|nr:tRNA dihydrouridine(20/20a) synthase DusA [Gammaproteobacteria bacterium]
MTVHSLLPSHRLCIAPMMDYTDRHARYLLRLLSKHIRLYTEMITAGAVCRGDREFLLSFDPQEHPVALQLGGNDPKALADAAQIGESFGYDEINLNIGCPSDRVQSARFGACLMAEPTLIAECVAAIRAKVAVPVTIKTRLGIDHHDSYEFLTNFVSTVHTAGCHTFIIHARKAWLQGLSPRENREIPPLDYTRVYRLKQDFPHLTIVINGGITQLAQASEHLNHCDGVMIGRAAFDNPYLLAHADQLLYGQQEVISTRHEIVKNYIPYIESQLAQGVPLARLTRHLLGLFHSVKGGRAWRRALSENAHRQTAGIDIVQAALENVIEED